MNRTWKTQPTSGAQVVMRAMQERGWKQADIALQAGLDAPTVSRWVRGAVTPSDHRVAEVAAALGYDPRDFGITSPSALARADRRNVTGTPTDDAPEWAIRHQAELLAAIKTLEIKIHTNGS